MSGKYGTGAAAVSPANHRLGGVQVKKIMLGTGSSAVEVWSSGLPVVTLTGTADNVSRDQFRAACVAYGTTYQTVQTLPFQLDTSAATNFVNLFEECSALTTIPPIDGNGVTSMSRMFYDCVSLTSIPALDTSTVTTMDSMFDNCTVLASVPPMDTSKVTSMTYMFWGNLALTNSNVTLKGRNPAAVTTGMIESSGMTKLPFTGTSGAVTPQTLTASTYTNIGSHTITSADMGEKVLSVTVNWANATGTKSLRILKNGTSIATNADKPLGTCTIATTCVPGDVITYQAYATSSTANQRQILLGYWGTAPVGPAPALAGNGTWGPSSVNATATVRASHTVATAGSYTITQAVAVTGSLANSRIDGPWGTTTGSNVSSGSTSTATTTQTLSAGAVINFLSIGSGTTSATGTWAVYKN